jgi:uncharacterized Zn-finger protein
MSLELLANTSSQLCLDDSKMDDNKFFRCADCNREFSSKRNLVDHFRGHHQGQKPHVCQQPGCGKSFLRPAHLLIHNRIHTGEKPFVCEHEGCGKRWNQKSALKQHMRSHTGEKPFVCTYDGCSKTFSTSSSCKRHISTHTQTNFLGQPKRKLNGLPMDSSDEEYDTRPMKKPSLSADLHASVGQVDELARKMTLSFILN